MTRAFRALATAEVPLLWLTTAPACNPYSWAMEVQISDPARRYLVSHGGTVFVRTHSYRCCSAGSLTLLDVETTPPPDALEFDQVDCGDIDVRFFGGRNGQPGELQIEMRGRFRPHLVAYWDGCAYKI